MDNLARDLSFDPAERQPGEELVLERILKQAELLTGISPDAILSPTRTTELVEARHLAMWLARYSLDLSYPEIGRAFGGKHHTTALHGVKKIDVRRAHDAEFSKWTGNALAQVLREMRQHAV